MTLRDWFAGQALAVLINRHLFEFEREARANGDDHPWSTECLWGAESQWYEVSDSAYAVADAMLKAREVNHD